MSTRMGFMSGLGSLLKGMKITFYYLVRPSTVVTQQYPENRATLKMADRLRAQLAMNHDENGYYKCTACHICEQACPNGSIHVLERPNPTIAKRELDTFIWRLDSCTFCNMCVLVCPFTCLTMKPNFESAVYDQRLLVYNLAQYAGATSQQLLKITDPTERQSKIEPRNVYDGPNALTGFPLAGICKPGANGGAPSAQGLKKELHPADGATPALLASAESEEES